MISSLYYAYNDTRRGIKKVFLFAKCCYNSTRSLIICITMGWHFALGIGNSVVIFELSLYAQSLLAKLTLDRLIILYYYTKSMSAKVAGVPLSLMPFRIDV